MNKPNFFIVGAPKCGTTSMAAWLSEHPQIFMSSPKEPFYYSSDLKSLNIFNEDSYHHLFKNASDKHLAIGEASTSYLYSRVAIPNIEKDYIKPKYIVMLRNPIPMAYSLHEQRLYDRHEHIDSFPEAWELSPSRRLGKNVGSLCVEPLQLDYQSICRLGEQVERLLQIVERERILFLLLDDLKKDPRSEYLKTLSFLGVPDDGRSDFSVKNPAKQVRSVLIRKIIKSLIIIRNSVGISSFGTGLPNYLQKVNTIYRPRVPLDSATEKKLKEFFSSDIKLLETLLNRDLSSWLC